ncbi:hypothetical protein ACFL2I_07430, partial [Candidatus Omnitrophota bacterium]
SEPIKIFKEGVDLGTLGSLGWSKAATLGIFFYWRKTKFIPWKHIRTIKIKPNIKTARILKITDTKGRLYHCRIEYKHSDKFYKKLTLAISRAVREDEN